MINTLPRFVRISDSSGQLFVPFESLDGVKLHGSLAVTTAMFGPPPEPNAGLAFQLQLHRDPDKEVVSDIRASFVAIYPSYVADLTVSQQADFLATKALPDLWPYWWTHLQRVVTQMGLIPLTERPANMEQLAAQVRQLCKQVEGAAHEA